MVMMPETGVQLLDAAWWNLSACIGPAVDAKVDADRWGRSGSQGGGFYESRCRARAARYIAEARAWAGLLPAAAPHERIAALIQRAETFVDGGYAGFDPARAALHGEVGAIRGELARSGIPTGLPGGAQ